MPVVNVGSYDRSYIRPQPYRERKLSDAFKNQINEIFRRCVKRMNEVIEELKQETITSIEKEIMQITTQRMERHWKKSGTTFERYSTKLVTGVQNSDIDLQGLSEQNESVVFNARSEGKFQGTEKNISCEGGGALERNRVSVAVIPGEEAHLIISDDEQNLGCDWGNTNRNKAPVVETVGTIGNKFKDHDTKQQYWPAPSHRNRPKSPSSFQFIPEASTHQIYRQRRTELIDGVYNTECTIIEIDGDNRDDPGMGVRNHKRKHPSGETNPIYKLSNEIMGKNDESRKYEMFQPVSPSSSGVSDKNHKDQAIIGTNLASSFRVAYCLDLARALSLLFLRFISPIFLEGGEGTDIPLFLDECQCVLKKCFSFILSNDNQTIQDICGAQVKGLKVYRTRRKQIKNLLGLPAIPFEVECSNMLKNFDDSYLSYFHFPTRQSIFTATSVLD